MDTRIFEFVNSLARTRSYSRSAKELFITTQGLSASIKRMEAKMGVPLFESDGKNLNLTPFGEVFYEHSRQIQTHIRAIRTEVNALLDGEAVELTIVSSFGLNAIVPLQSFHEFNEMYEKKAQVVKTRTMLEYQCQEALLVKEFDYALLCIPHDEERIDSIPLYRDFKFLWVPQDSEIAQRGYALKSDIAGQRFACLPPDDFIVSTECAAPDDFRAAEYIYANDYIELLRVTVDNQALGMTCRTQAEMFVAPGYTAVPIRDITWGFDLCWLKDRPLVEADNLFIQYLKGQSEFFA